jgi:hypothetical protein
MFPAVFQADFPAGSSPTLALNPKPLPSPLMKISALLTILRFRLTARIPRVMQLLRSNRP